MHFHLLLSMKNESERLDYSVMEACWVVFCLFVACLLAFLLLVKVFHGSLLYGYPTCVCLLYYICKVVYDI